VTDQIAIADVRRFLKYVRRDHRHTFEGTPCWRWIGHRHPKGYGVFRLGGRGVPPLMAHRVAWIIFVGPIPEGKHIHHRCYHPWCVNPLHTEPVWPRQNSLWMNQRRNGTGDGNGSQCPF